MIAQSRFYFRRDQNVLRLMQKKVKRFSSNGPQGRGPVSWTVLGMVGVLGAAAVSYYRIERERRMEEALGKVVSSESDGWTPDSRVWRPRKFKETKFGWFPEDDTFGPRESKKLKKKFVIQALSNFCIKSDLTFVFFFN